MKKKFSRDVLISHINLKGGKKLAEKKQEEGVIMPMALFSALAKKLKLNNSPKSSIIVCKISDEELRRYEKLFNRLN